MCGAMTEWHAGDITSALATRQSNTRSRLGIAPAQYWNASAIHACLSSTVSAPALAVVLKIQTARSPTRSARVIFRRAVIISSPMLTLTTLYKCMLSLSTLGRDDIRMADMQLLTCQRPPRGLREKQIICRHQKLAVTGKVSGLPLSRPIPARPQVGLLTASTTRDSQSAIAQ